MIQSEGSHLGCVCPECGNRCTACLGTDCVMNKESILSLKDDPVLAERIIERFCGNEEDGEKLYEQVRKRIKS